MCVLSATKKHTHNDRYTMATWVSSGHTQKNGDGTEVYRTQATMGTG